MPQFIDRYTYLVTWSDEDHEYIGTCTEFPSLSWLSKTQKGAIAGIRRLVKECADDMDEKVD